jgi:hypothetical protein
MNPKGWRCPDYDDPNLYLCPHCGQVILIGNDELAGNEEVVRLRMSHPCPGVPTIRVDADSFEQLCDPGTGRAVGEGAHNRAGPATVGAG